MTWARTAREHIASIVFTLAVNVVAASPLTPRFFRSRLLRAAGVRLGRCTISARCFVGSPRLSVGDGSFVNVGVFFDGVGAITVGDNVHIAMGAMILTSSHQIGEADRRGGAMTARDVVIGDGAWIGARVTVLPGVHVAPGVVIAAGAVVVEDCEPHRLYAGVPARRIRTLDAAQ